MGHAKLSVTIPDEVYGDIRKLASIKKIKLSHLVTEALVEKIRKAKEQNYIQQVNAVFNDDEVREEQLRMADVIAKNTDIDELPW